MHPQLHGVSGPWSGSLVEGAVGTLFSPNRGLFIFSPWIAVALGVAAVPGVTRRLASQGLIAWLFAALIPYFLLLSKYSVWWGGHCFAQRYWTDVIPLFAVVLAFGLDWIHTHARSSCVHVSDHCRLDRCARLRRILLPQYMERFADKRGPASRAALGLA